MARMLPLIITAVLFAHVDESSAAFTLGITDVSATTIQPGQSVTFSVRLDGVTDLSSYTIPVFVEGSSGTPGSSFDFSPLPTQPATGYVFRTPTGNFAVSKTTSVAGFPLRERLTVSDYLAGAVDTNSGNSLVFTA